MSLRAKIFQDWQVGHHAGRKEAPLEWVKATVPGAVQLDWAAAKNYPDYTYSDNYKQFVWMEDIYWTYRTRLAYPALDPGQRLFFVCGGVDYRFQVGLGDQTLHDQEGMFTPFEIELTRIANPGDELWVCIFPVPKSFTPDPEINNRDAQRGQANHCCKPAVSYGWDFHPRLIPSGIWQETCLEIRPPAFLSMAELDYRLNEACTLTDIQVEVAVDGSPSSSLCWELLDPDRKVVFSEETPARSGTTVLQAVLENPRLWWPHDQGLPELYTSRVKLVDPSGQVVDAKEQRIGFRRVRLVTNEDAWKHPRYYPKSRSHAPMTLEINGRRIFAKGSNWVSPHIFPGLLARETYEYQVGAAKKINMNILRCWGGATVQKDSFFDVCDELGVMVWQEFPLACNDYPDDPAYLKVLDQESRSIITTLKHHASIVMWCGGNELFNDWSGMDEQSLPLRLLDSNCYLLDPERPYIMTSPLDGAGHGSYWMIDWSTGREAWELFQEGDGVYTAYCEFSASSSLRDVETLKKFIPEDALWPVYAHPAWVAHKAVDPNGRGIHLPLSNISHYFGETHTIEEMIERSRFIHGQGVRGVFEEVRRQKMRASMALNWCLNEPWPNAAGSGNLLTWYNTTLPVYAEVGKALRPVLASARIPRLKWKPGDLFNPEIWALSDSPESTPSATVQAWIELEPGCRTLLLEWRCPELPPNTNARGPLAQFRLPAANVERFKLILQVPEHPEMDSEYPLLLGK